MDDESKLQFTSDSELISNKEGIFTKYKFEFTRELNSTEKDDAIKHFENGLKEQELSEVYTISAMDFPSSQKFIITFKHVDLDYGAGLLWLKQQFKKKFPVTPTVAWPNGRPPSF